MVGSAFLFNQSTFTATVPGTEDTALKLMLPLLAFALTKFAVRLIHHPNFMFIGG